MKSNGLGAPDARRPILSASRFRRLLSRAANDRTARAIQRLLVADRPRYFGCSSPMERYRDRIPIIELQKQQGPVGLLVQTHLPPIDHNHRKRPSDMLGSLAWSMPEATTPYR